MINRKLSKKMVNIPLFFTLMWYLDVDFFGVKKSEKKKRLKEKGMEATFFPHVGNNRLFKIGLKIFEL